MMVLASALLLALLPFADPAASSPLALPRITDTLPCSGPAEEIVVCGRRPRTERYRIPVELRERPLTAQDYAWATRARDEREAGRYEDQVSGPGAAYNRSRQVDCQWRAERQQLNGRQVDCSQHIPFELRN